MQNEHADHPAPLTIGLVTPSTNTINALEWHEALGAQVKILPAHMRIHGELETENGRETLFSDLSAVTRTLGDRGATAVAYGCTAGSIVLPPEELAQVVGERAGMPVVATAPALVDAVKSMGISCVALATPYYEAMTEEEAVFLEACGIRVVTMHGLGVGRSGPSEFACIADMSPEVVWDLVKTVDHPDAGAIIISCTNLRTRDFHADLEKHFGKPVLSSNQVTLWALAKALGSPQLHVEWGHLMRKPALIA